MATEESTELMDFYSAEEDENVVVETKSSIVFVFLFNNTATIINIGH
jgi:hypothetical protein